MKTVALGLFLVLAHAGAAAATCAVAPLPPPREPGCRDMESVCVCYGSSSTDCAWRYYCVPDRGPDYYQRSYDRPRARKLSRLLPTRPVA